MCIYMYVYIYIYVYVYQIISYILYYILYIISSFDIYIYICIYYMGLSMVGPLEKLASLRRKTKLRTLTPVGSRGGLSRRRISHM